MIAPFPNTFLLPLRRPRLRTARSLPPQLTSRPFIAPTPQNKLIQHSLLFFPRLSNLIQLFNPIDFLNGILAMLLLALIPDPVGGLSVGGEFLWKGLGWELGG
jgi:hypothetical protein